jgi:hypothetical protein
LEDPLLDVVGPIDQFAFHGWFLGETGNYTPIQQVVQRWFNRDLNAPLALAV